MSEDGKENHKTPLTKNFQEGNSQESLEPWQREVDGMYQAIQFIQQKARGVADGGFGRDDIFALHKLVINDPLNPEFAGVLRDVPVQVGIRVAGEVKLAAFEPADVTFLSEYFNEFAGNLEEETRLLSSATSVEDAIELAAKVHFEFIKIHPFRDGNGRTARMLVDYIFRKARLPYIKDWGVLGDEYKDVVYRIYDEDNIDLLKGFLANKLYERLEGIQDLLGANSLNDAGFVNYIRERIQEVGRYLITFN